MTLVCAHRGASLRLGDNTVEAFVAAIATGCDVIETDVRRRPDDGVLVLAHDTWDVDDADVVPLSVLLDLARGRIGLDLEIVEPGLERMLLDALDGFHDGLMVTSTFPSVLRDVARLTTQIDIGLVVEAPPDGPPAGSDPFALTAECGAAITLVEDAIVTPELLVRAAGRPLWVWTVNDAARITALLAEPAVTAVITDDPQLACDLRA